MIGAASTPSDGKQLCARTVLLSPPAAFPLHFGDLTSTPMWLQLVHWQCPAPCFWLPSTSDVTSLTYFLTSAFLNVVGRLVLLLEEKQSYKESEEETNTMSLNVF
jgi:hypothetical protein